MTTNSRQDATVEPEDVQRFDEQIDPYLSFLRATPERLARLVEHVRSELVGIESDEDHRTKARRVEVLREHGQDQLNELLLAVYSAQDKVEGILMRTGRPMEPSALRERVDAARAEFEGGWSRLKQAIRHTEHELSGNWGAVLEIPDWAEHRTIRLKTLADFYRASHDGSETKAHQPATD
ncbi:hypothetical protein [Nitrolancea hollandica]|uniref:Uncharacterized protein n=1 Tax=Nitrolancea hollandica Lb TaxID=1129897 RepID=I4EEH1_9BACT|nr:hypothetical protein [Nitrolancea hollandica]CCF83083.1 hypothetical protein NITHO_1830015 [Nitrolancea hollandica Lb]